MSLEDLRVKRKKLKENIEKVNRDMNIIIKENHRVAKVAHNAEYLINDLENEFSKQTGLNGVDVSFLFLATALQLSRIIIINMLTKIEKAGVENKKEHKLHEMQNKILNKDLIQNNNTEKPYYSSLKHIITTLGVPYDATRYLNDKTIELYLNKGHTWNFDPNDLKTENLKIFKGANHRFATLGHDPILGLIFGTANIMTNTITSVKKEGVLPIIKTNHVVYTSLYKNPSIGKNASTLEMFNQSVKRTIDDPKVFVASLIKQIIHIGTDLYTPCGIQIPGANLVLSNKETEKFTRYISTGDFIKIEFSAKISELINNIITVFHNLLYDEQKYSSRELYNVKTKKIILYSNLIASSSNVIWVGANMYSGNEKAIKDLDIGGLLVTLYHLIYDTRYIQKIKEEFVLNGFKDMIKGDKLNLEEIE
ncbi:hypothetical protein [Leptotrichia sp. oral taxon 223]|uniref:hypothetical protein n=1 Tax=Leptotrichia sp. oral taxon 223 TaxID=712363 RepID=UPI0015C123F3|nr:hypothetical protein [Leptotrichia sp. oral taxon 223]NWO18236.1 hypothetical protein [Leptotrichia sp. oral taxon 223]